MLGHIEEEIAVGVLGHLLSGGGVWRLFLVSCCVVIDQNVMLVWVELLKDVYCCIGLGKNFFICEIPVASLSCTEDDLRGLGPIRGAKPTVMAEIKLATIIDTPLPFA